MQCNIDARGRAARLVAGLVTFVIGLVLVIVAWLADGGFGLLGWAGLGLLAAGGFGIFEGWAGWCAVRALGIRTRI